MKHTLPIALALAFLCGGCYYQGATYSATSSPQSISIKSLPDYQPDLNVTANFSSESGKNFLEAGEKGYIRVTVENAGRGKAINLICEVTPDPAPGLQYSTSLVFGDVSPGDSRSLDIPIDVSPYVKEQAVSLEINFKEDNGYEPAPIKVSFYIKPGVDTDIPQARYKNPNAVALIISIPDYQVPGVPKVKFAKDDAESVRQYLIKGFGFRAENILPSDPNEVMTYGRIQTYIKSKLPSYLKPDGSSDLFIYYTGHGAPSTANHEAYLVPSDCDPNYISDDNAYSLKQFYLDIQRLKARHKFIVVDACFSGDAGNGQSLIKDASPALLKVNNPLIADTNTVILQSSSADQVSNWYEDKHHGMFTYFFLKGLQGAADYNHDGTITASELVQYINDRNDGLPYWSNRLYHRLQEAQLQGDGQTVVERLKK